MMKKTWPALKSCTRQCLEARGRGVNDRLSELPHEVLLLIMSFLTMKEAAKTSVLSHSWKYIWQCFPVLFFEADSSAMERIKEDGQLISQERPGFTRWVNSVVEAHRGPAIDELRVIFDLDISCESDIDKWVVFALAKQVKRLELNFTPLSNTCISLSDCYIWPLECRMSSLCLHRNLASLRSLRLKYINLTVKDIECVLLSCYALEDLCIVGGSTYLTHIELPHSSLQLKHLEVSCCPRILCIDIFVPKLVSFTYHGRPIALRIRGASLLSAVSIGNGDYRGEVVADAYNSLSTYFPQLEYLSWDLLFNNNEFGIGPAKWNMRIHNPPAMTNLRHLEFHVRARNDASLLGWASLIEASPVLQKLTLKFSGRARPWGLFQMDTAEHKGRPLMALKTLELVGSLGQPIDMEFATFIVENSIMLKEVIFSPRWRTLSNYKHAMDRMRKFFSTCLSQGVCLKGRFSPTNGLKSAGLGRPESWPRHSPIEKWVRATVEDAKF